MLRGHQNVESLSVNPLDINPLGCLQRGWGRASRHGEVALGRLVWGKAPCYGETVSAGAVLFCLGPSWEVEASGGRQRFLPQPFLLPLLPVPRSALFAQVWKGEGMGEVNH